MEDFIVRKIWRKIGKKYNHKYYDKKGKEIKDKKKIETFIKGVYIAPAYDNVKINLKKDEKVLAIGYDEKGRSQYVYNKKYTQSQSYKKFDKMILFGKNFYKINNKINDDLYSVKDSKNKQIAIILKLIMECQFRIGNDVYSKKNKSYGTTTLQGKHIRIKNKNELVIDFNGKKNVRNVCTVKNKKLVIRSPNATRPWQHVIEPLFGYISLSKKLFYKKKYVGSWNFGPSKKNNLKVIEVAKFSKQYLNSKSKIIVKKNKFYESTNLSLNSTKSLKFLKYPP